MDTVVRPHLTIIDELKIERVKSVGEISVPTTKILDVKIVEYTVAISNLMN